MLIRNNWWKENDRQNVLREKLANLYVLQNKGDIQQVRGSNQQHHCTIELLTRDSLEWRTHGPTSSNELEGNIKYV